MLRDEHRRYLRLLGFTAAPRGLEGLQQLVLRQLCRVPFENVSKLLLYGRERAARVTTIDEYLDGIEFHDLGGTCYSANPYFAQLLTACGYEAQLLGASMATPNVHTCIRVHLEHRDYHIDVGYASPFRAPMRIDQMPQEVVDGGERYVLRRAEESGEITVGVYSGLDRVHGYRAHNTTRTFDFFRETILESYRPGKTFMSCLRIARFFERHSVHVRDRVLTIKEGTQETQLELKSISELEDAVWNRMKMPRCPIREAVSVLQELMGEPLFRI